jgi:hypothetical protein
LREGMLIWVFCRLINTLEMERRKGIRAIFPYL